jgi:hypothetical protein
MSWEEGPSWVRAEPVGLCSPASGSYGSPPQSPPQIRPFRQDDFLRSLEHAGPQLTCILKGDWLGLYRWEDIGHRLQGHPLAHWVSCTAASHHPQAVFQVTPF